MSPHTQPLCVVTDTYVPAPERALRTLRVEGLVPEDVLDPSLPRPERENEETVNIHSVRELVEHLRDFVDQKPRILSLEKPGGPRLCLGIGGELGAIQAYPYRNCPPGERPSWTAQANSAYATEGKDFCSQIS